MADAYEEVIVGSLNLKTTDSGMKRKKKKKKLKKDAIEAEMKASTQTEGDKTGAKGKSTRRPKTAAEKAFDEVQLKRQAERILKKAAKSHKQRVEELNQHLDDLSEHYDVPKVSWTK